MPVLLLGAGRLVLSCLHAVPLLTPSLVGACASATGDRAASRLKRPCQKSLEREKDKKNHHTFVVVSLSGSRAEQVVSLFLSLSLHRASAGCWIKHTHTQTHTHAFVCLLRHPAQEEVDCCLTADCWTSSEWIRRRRRRCLRLLPSSRASCSQLIRKCPGPVELILHRCCCSCSCCSYCQSVRLLALVSGFAPRVSASKGPGRLLQESVRRHAGRQAEPRPPSTRERERARRSFCAGDQISQKGVCLFYSPARYSSTNQIRACISILYLLPAPFSFSSSFRLWPLGAFFHLKTASSGLIAPKILTAGAHGQMEAIIGL